MDTSHLSGAEAERLRGDAQRAHNWKRWGPYLPERQWGTVREDYSPDGSCWRYFPHDHARSRTYRWGEDGLMGWCDRQCRLCFGLALWNERDPILKERMFGLTGEEGNHGEDVKEHYFYLDGTPTHALMKGLYKYPQREFPYEWLVRENKRRGRAEPEFDLSDTGAFDEARYFDVSIDYAKRAPDDTLIRIRAVNRGPEAAPLHLLPSLWFRNTWSWGRTDDGWGVKPGMRLAPSSSSTLVRAETTLLGVYEWHIAPASDGQQPQMLFTENETNFERVYGTANPTPFVKDGFHRRVVDGVRTAVNPQGEGTKSAAWFRFVLAPGEQVELRLRLSAPDRESDTCLGPEFDRVFRLREAEADEFYKQVCEGLGAEEQRVSRQAYAGLLWTKQYYHYVVKDWLHGDPKQPPPPASRLRGRNIEWDHLFNRDVISMPDKWEYPWYAAWDLAFQMIPFADIDPYFTKDQLLLFLREWYMHPSGQLPAYEFGLSDVNPPVHAWACWRVYKRTAPSGKRDRLFLSRTFQKLLLNFTWWVNRKDPLGRGLFSGGFLGLDNIGVFDRGMAMPLGGHLEQADGTAWMAFYCGHMLSMALELARGDVAYEDMASKFFEHFIEITDAMNDVAGRGLWHEHDGFYYDQILLPSGGTIPLQVRSIVGLIPLLAAVVLEQDVIDQLPGFKKRMEWYVEHRADLARHVTYLETDGHAGGAGHYRHQHSHRLLAIPSRDRLQRCLKYLFDENEFLSPFGVRSLSMVHRDKPYTFKLDGQLLSVDYTPGESLTSTFGGNSNWRGPIWIPINYLIIEALERYARFYGDTLLVEVPTGSGRMVNLYQAAAELRARLSRLFLPDHDGRRPLHGAEERFARDEHWKDLVYFYEHFHADTGRGLGAAHQTGWTALIATILQDAGLGPQASSKAAYKWGDDGD
ncbi:MAG: glucosidase [Planctomycetota bacterium]|nr:glucosidase [Planctomycetota bacterium]